MFGKTKPLWLDYLFLIAILGALFLVNLGNRPFSSPDEGRYTEIPREMVQSGDYLTPHLNGLKYFEKPPFVYWFETLPLKLGFSSEFAMRLPIALFALLGCLSVYAYARRVYRRSAGLLSAIVLGTSILYFALGRLILLDLVLGVFLSMGLFSFIIGIKLCIGKERRIHLGFASASFACAVLTKGLIGLVLPIAIIGIWVIGLNKWKDLLPLYLPTNLLIFFGISLPWHILVSIQNPEFFDFYFIHEHFERYLTTVHRRAQPFWFFIPIFIIGFFPWIFFLPKAIKNFIPKKMKDWKVYDLEAFLIVWSLFIALFFSFSSSKLIPYIIPIFPPMAIVVGRFLAYVIESEKSTKIEATLYFIISTALAFGIPFVLQERNDPDLFVSLMPYFFSIKVYLITGSGLFLIFSFLEKLKKGRFWVLTLFHVLFLFTINATGSFVQKMSMKPFAEYIKNNISEEAHIVFYNMYAQDLPFYLNKTVKILDWSGELDFGKKIEPKNSTFLTRGKFTNLWKTEKNMCVISKKNFIPGIPFSGKTPPILLEKEEYVLLCKKSDERL